MRWLVFALALPIGCAIDTVPLPEAQHGSGGDASPDRDEDDTDLAAVNGDVGEDAGDGDAVPAGPSCADDAVLDTSSSLCWRRCPATQEWGGSECMSSGRDLEVSWNDAQAACPEPFRMATVAEVTTMLGGCAPDVVSAGGACHSCAQSSVCTGLFGLDERAYWTGTVNAAIADEAWRVDFGAGVVSSESTSARVAVRCVVPAD